MFNSAARPGLGMRVVIVTGISGIRKSEFLENFVRGAGIGGASQVVKFEDELANQARRGPGITPPASVATFLEQDSPSGKVAEMEKAFAWMADGMRVRRGVRYVFLDVHLAYYKKTEYFPPLNPALFARWIASVDPAADVRIINLIDDVFSIWQTLRGRERAYPNTRLTLREILAWRSLETLQSDSLAASINAAPGRMAARSYVVSIKHPLPTFRNLVVPRVPVSVYLSYAISRTRNDPAKVAEINAFRRRIHAMGGEHGVAVFDPVTIDEMILTQARPARPVVIDGSVRWPLDQEGMLVGDDPPVRLSAPEVRGSLDHVRHQVRSRDLRLVEQAALLVVYRPFFGGPSTGALAEIAHGRAAGVDACVYSPAQDRVPRTDNPFDGGMAPIRGERRFYQAVEEKMLALAGRGAG